MTKKFNKRKEYILSCPFVALYTANSDQICQGWSYHKRRQCKRKASYIYTGTPDDTTMLLCMDHIFEEFYLLEWGKYSSDLNHNNAKILSNWRNSK